MWAKFQDIVEPVAQHRHEDSSSFRVSALPSTVSDPSFCCCGWFLGGATCLFRHMLLEEDQLFTLKSQRKC